MENLQFICLFSFFMIFTSIWYIYKLDDCGNKYRKLNILNNYSSVANKKLQNQINQKKSQIQNRQIQNIAKNNQILSKTKILNNLENSSNNLITSIVNRINAHNNQKPISNQAYSKPIFIKNISY